MPSSTILTVAALTATYMFLRALALLSHNAKEPTAVVGSIPFISNIFGMISQGGRFYVRMRDELKLPIYTLRIPGPPIYVVNSLQTLQRIDRHILTVAFSPIQAQACQNAMAVSKNGMATIAGEKQLTEDGYLRSLPRSFAAGTSPGPGLNELNRAATSSLEHWAARGPRRFKLFDWAWFTFESGILTILLGLLPQIFARPSLKARETLVSVLRQYFQQNRHLEASLFIRLRHQHNAAFGLDAEDTARTEIGQVAAGIVNTIPSAFWMVWQVFSNPAVLSECRQEVEDLVETDSKGVSTLDIARVRTRFPVLISTWQEVMRFHGISIAARIVQADTMIDDQYLLKKAGVVLMPNAVIHSDESLWGPSVGQFNHRRFMKSEKDAQTRHPAAAFRGFGGGHVLCPGRHFASTEILGLVALLLVQFDILPTGGKWNALRTYSAMDRAFPLLKTDVEVELIPKQRKLKVIFSDDSTGIDIVKEDAAASLH
ncbi:cytochrome P450 [Xylariaceae sp. FL1272]|nr:cytochrome P450 [Xylariaceae sp. FL1272]